jgi:hypothetical protein
MVNPISSPPVSDADQVPQLAPRPPQPQAQTQKSGELSSDMVTLKQAGVVDHDGDSG